MSNRGMTVRVRLSYKRDDIKLYCIYEQDKCMEAQSALQASIENLCNWTSNYGVPFDLNKCTVMHIGSSDTPMYTVNGTFLKSCSSFKDLRGQVYYSDMNL